MSNEFDYENRQLIPRLLPFRIANALLLNHHSSKRVVMNALEEHNYLKLITEWNMDKRIDIGIDIISYKIAFDSILIPEDINQFLIDNVNYLNESQRELFYLYQSKDLKEVAPVCEKPIDITKEIREIKKSNNINNKNPILWCDLGYYYTSLGLTKQASKCYLVALGLTNHNRHVIRSASRYYLHIDEPEKALYVLRKSPNIRNDIGILSAEIAISELAGKKSKNIDFARKFVDNDDYSILEKNELLAQFATLEFSYGKDKIGRKLIEQCLKMPNENSLAQFEFLSRRFPNIGRFSSDDYDVLCKHEALARFYHIRNEYENVFTETENWSRYQPFSIQPACYGSYIASTILNDHNKAINILTKALKIAPKNFALLNNYAFALASLNNSRKASEILNRIDLKELDSSELATLNATSGLVKIKQGDIARGKVLYENSINYFIKNKNFYTLARAKYHFGVALESVEPNKSFELILESFELAQKLDFIDLLHVIARDYKTINL